MSSLSTRSPLRRLGLLSATMLLGLAACATPFKADVKRFAGAMPAPAGQTFAVVADDPRDAGGLEFAQYADLVAAQMGRLGYVRTAPEHAAMLVRFDYDVDKGRDRIRQTGGSYGHWSPWYGPGFGYPGYYGRGFGRPFGRYGGFGSWGYGWHDPFFYDDGIDVVTVYTSEASLKIDRKADGQRLFEGRAEAASRSNRLGYLVPNLIEAVFTDFPGRSGETVRISIAPEDGKKTVRPIRDRDYGRQRDRY